MAFVQTLGGTEQVVIAGSFNPDVSTVRGTGYSVAVASGVFTITLDRAYNGLIGCTASVMNPSAVSGESLIANIVSHSITDGTSGGTIVINSVDDTGAIETGGLTAGCEIHFTAVLDVDT
mgnify:CR=1 FL=1